MKSKFGFIPIVLPVLVMVLIIGLINLGGPQGAQAQQASLGDTDPRLSPDGLTVTPAGGAAITPTRDSAGSVGVSGTSTMYMASVDYEDTTVSVTATAEGSPASSISITLPRRLGSTTTSPTAEVKLNVGDNVFKIKVTEDANTSRHTTYTLTVKRNLPDLDSLDVRAVAYTDGEPDPDLTSGDLETLDPAIPTGNVEEAALLMDEKTTMFKASVDYNVTSTTVQVDVGATADLTNEVSEPSEAMRVAFSGVSLASSTADTTTGAYNAIAKLKVGVNNLRITVRGSGGEFSTGNSRTYTLAITRKKPELEGLELQGADGTALPTDVDAVMRHGPQMASTTVEGLLTGNEHNTAFRATTTSYMARVKYDRGSVRVVGTPKDMVEVKYTVGKDAIPATADLDLKLARGVNNVTVRAVATDNSREYRDYTIAITRENTPLLTLALTNPDMTAKAEDGSDFAPATSTMAMATVDYEEDTIDVAATANADTMIKLTGGGDLATGTETLDPSTRKLNVGANRLEIMAGIPGNTSTYILTVTREEPKPRLQFTVLNEDGDELGSPTLPLTLDAASRSYNILKNSDGTYRTDITSDDLLTATDVRVCVADADDGDLNNVRVSLNGVTVPDCGVHYLERELNEVTTNLEFDVDHPGDLTGTLHTVSISRKANSVPVFPANHILRSRTGENGVQAVHGTTITPTVELPMAVSGTGNGALTYDLLSVEADGPSTDLPSGLTFDKPDMDGNGENGKLKMSPSILDSSDRAVFNLILKVSDSDAITGSSDEDTIPFTIIVFRDESLLPSGPSITPRLGDLRDLEVLEERPEGKKTDKLMPEFSLLRYSYSAEVFTDTTEVDFVAKASSDATVRLEGSATDNTTPDGDETTHTWEGYRLHTGPGARNTYRVTVEEGGETRTYTVQVTRQLAARPMFDMDRKAMEYYEGIDLDDLPDVAKALPVATGGNGSSTYTLKRSRDTAPDKDDFLGLELMGATSTPVLSGTPVLDEDKADLYRLSDRSEAYGLYTVHDEDEDETDSDADTMNIDVKVYRDVTLGNYVVSGKSSGDLGPMSKVYNSGRTYSHESLAKYRFNAAYDVSTVTFVANPRGADAEVLSIMPADADGNASNGHQLSLGQGDNVITVTVGNGVVRGTHLINIKRPGLQLTGITITEDEDARDNSRLTGNVELVRPDDMKGFNRDVYSYTATVETWVRSVQVRATAADPNARVFVNTFEIPEREGYSVVDLEIGTTTIILGASVGTDEPDPRYTVVITRKSSSAPAFEMDADNYIRQEGVDVAMAPCQKIVLPKAMGGDGTLTYYLVNQEQLPPGLNFNAGTREISGIPTLDEGYESDFDLILAVKDSDADTSDADGDTTSFTITITQDAAKARDACEPEPVAPVQPANTLSSLVVTYTLDGRTDIPATLDPEFMPESGGPYTAIIPHGATDVQVTAVRADAGATIAMNSVRIVSGVKLDLPPNATITVRHPDFTESMSYTLTTSRVADTAPTFGGATIDDQVFESGMDIDAMTLPAATGGNRTITYTLVDHEGNVPDGLMFDASSRELTGRPALVQDADSTLYRMTYKATDADGQSAMIMFNITVCDPDRASGCTPTVPEPNPGQTPMDLMVERSSGSTSATITWRPGDDAASQLVAAVDLNNIVASINATVATLAGDAGTHTFEGLSADVSYTYLVIGLDANGGYSDPDTASGVSGMAVAE